MTDLSDAAEPSLDSFLDSLDELAGFSVLRVIKEDGPCGTYEAIPPAGSPLGPLPVILKKTTLSSCGALPDVLRDIMAAQAHGRLGAHIPRVLDVRVIPEVDELVVIESKVPGATLAQVVGRDGPGVECARRVFPGLCAAVGELHTALGSPIIHRDLKPSNVMMDGDDVYVIDLGIARMYTEGREHDTDCLGTRGYAPPEQYGFGQTDVRSDVYSLGAILFFCLTGRDFDPSCLQKAASWEGVPKDLEAIVRRAVAFSPAERYAGVPELASAFKRADLAQGPARWLTRVWNALVLAVWAFLIVVFVLMSADPTVMPGRHPAYKLLGYLILMPVLLSTMAFALLARKPMEARLPWLGRFRGAKGLILALAGAAVDFIGFGFLALLE